MALKDLMEKSEFEGHMDELQPGTVLLHGQYTITRFLNNGGFGITYLAKDSLDRDVVIKECFADAFCRRTNTIVSARSRAHQNELKSIIRLFIQEARSLSKLKHPNIVGVHQVFEDNDTAYMAIDFVDGKDLMEILDDPTTRLTPDQIVEITRKLLSAIGYVHEHGLLHRDISPDNILLNRQGEPILIDFGAAREHVSDGGRRHSALRVVKDGYSPQEFYIAGSEQGPWSDLYALAASLYHAIKGEAPVNGQARLAAIAEQRPDPYEPLAGAVAGYPAGFLEAIDKAMSTKPADRIQTSAEWLEMIDGPAATHAAIDGNPEEAVSKLLILSNAAEDGRAAAAGSEVFRPSTFQALAAEEPVPADHTAAKRRGGLRAVSVLALLAALGFAGYTLIDGEGSAPKPDAVAPAQTTEAPAAPVETAAAATAEVAPAVIEVAPDVPADAPTAAGTEATAAAAAPEAEAPAGEPAAAAAQEAEMPAGEPAAAAADEPVDAAVPEPAAAAADEPVDAAVPEPEAAGEEAAAVPDAPAETDVAEVPVEVTEEPVAAAPGPAAEAGAEEVAAAEPVVEPAPAPASSGPVLDQQVTFALWDIAFPFEFSQNAVRNAQVVMITGVLADADLAVAGSWITPGTEIYTVNDEPFSVERPFPTLVLNAMVVDPDGYARTTVRYKGAETQRFERGLLAVPVVRRFGLADGTTLEAGMVDGRWATKITALAGETEGGLRVGDVLVRETGTGAVFETAQAIETTMAALVETGAETARFEVMRDGGPTTAEVALARAN